MIQYVQRSRKRGAKLPENTRCCIRGTKWGNPFMGLNAVANYRIWLPRQEYLNISELAEYDYLACWCPENALACHVRDVLIPMVNKYLREKGATG